MSQEPTPTAAPAEGLMPEGANGQEPTPVPKPTPEPAAKPAAEKSFGEEYVKQLRKESASARTTLSTVQAELDALKDRDKTDTQRLTDRAAESEKRAGAAETQLIRYEVAALRGLDLKMVNAIAGTTRDEIEANAAVIAESLAAVASAQPKPPGFDGGARSTPEATKPPDAAHNDFLLGLLGRKP